MKTSAKQLFLIAALIATSTIFYSFSSQQIAGDKYLIMYCYEGPKEIFIVDENGKTEKRNIGHIDNNESSITITKTVNELSNRGYELVTTNGDLSQQKYVFKKK